LRLTFVQRSVVKGSWHVSRDVGNHRGRKSGARYGRAGHFTGPRRGTPGVGTDHGIRGKWSCDRDDKRPDDRQNDDATKAVASKTGAEHSSEPQSAGKHVPTVSRKLPKLRLWRRTSHVYFVTDVPFVSR
jgi:hypothetical protein